MAIVDLVEWQTESNTFYAWKFPHENLSTYTQLVVRESQEAVLFAKGQIIGKFGPGKHTLSTENLPLLRNLYGIPFGKKNPFTAEVWFVNRVVPLNIDWKISTMRFQDPDYGEMIPVVAEGRYGLKVSDAERFLVKLVGTLTQFTASQLTDHFLGALITKTKSVIVQYMQVNRIGIKTISAYLEPLSNFLKEPMQEFWEGFGMLLTGFYVTSVDIDAETDDGKKIVDALSARTAQNIAGFTWQQEQSFKVANNAFTKGGDMGVLGAVMLTGAIANNNMANMMLQPPQQPQAANFAPPSNRREVFCSNCAKKYPASSKFCPYCGDINNPCPSCGTDNAQNAKRCVSCGRDLSVPAPSAADQFCPRCGQGVTAGQKFCQNCGNKIG
jgi:membrane protease subunit (stomatin/prohibitin family)